jgi:type II secretory pathway component PulJ
MKRFTGRLGASDGFSLIDLTVGLALLGIVLLAIYALFPQLVRASRAVRGTARWS